MSRLLTQLDVNADSKLSREEYADLVAEEEKPSARKQPSMPHKREEVSGRGPLAGEPILRVGRSGRRS